MGIVQKAMKDAPTREQRKALETLGREPQNTESEQVEAVASASVEEVIDIAPYVTLAKPLRDVCRVEDSFESQVGKCASFDDVADALPRTIDRAAAFMVVYMATSSDPKSIASGYAAIGFHRNAKELDPQERLAVYTWVAECAQIPDESDMKQVAIERKKELERQDVKFDPETMKNPESFGKIFEVRMDLIGKISGITDFDRNPKKFRDAVIDRVKGNLRKKMPSLSP